MTMSMEKEFDTLFTVKWADKSIHWDDFTGAVSPENVKAHITKLLNTEREEIAREIDSHVDPDEYYDGFNRGLGTAIAIARSRITK